MTPDPTSPEGLAALEALARAATPFPAHHAPGDRSYGEEEQFLVICDDEAREVPVIFVEAGDHEGEPPEAFPRAVSLAAYIAAFDPPTVLALTARIRELERDKESLVSSLRACDDAYSQFVEGE